MYPDDRPAGQAVVLGGVFNCWAGRELGDEFWGPF